jgi:3-oxoacyl-[acyl-carrier protein] reductase
MRLENKVAIVTGAGSGIGRACALLMAEEGAKVVATDILAGRVEETARLIEDDGGVCIPLTNDVSSSGDVDRMVSTTVDRFGRLDILVNNAGILVMKSLLETTEEEWDRVQAVNLKSMFLSSKRAIPEMLKAGKGKIVNIASMAVFSTDAYHPAYASSKAGVIALTQATALEFARRNININCICPGSIRTNIAFPAEQMPYRTPAKGIPIGYMGEPEDIAGVALFLASEDSDYMAGEYILVDGGQSKNLYPVFSSFAMHEELGEEGRNPKQRDRDRTGQPRRCHPGVSAPLEGFRHVGSSAIGGEGRPPRKRAGQAQRS